MLLFLLLLVSISFSQKLKVLYEDGRVGVVDVTKISLNALQRVVYTEKPIRVKYLDQLVYSSSVAIRGSGSFNFSINTSPGQNLSVLSAGASVSFSGACSGGLDNLFCSGGPLNFNVSSSSDWRLVVQSVGKNIFLSDVSPPPTILALVRSIRGGLVETFWWGWWIRVLTFATLPSKTRTVPQRCCFCMTLPPTGSITDSKFKA